MGLIQFDFIEFIKRFVGIFQGLQSRFSLSG